MNAAFAAWYEMEILLFRERNLKRNPQKQPMKATVLQSRDPDIKPGTEVEIVGYAAKVPAVTRTANISSHSTAPATVCFEIHELQLKEESAYAPAVLAAMQAGVDRILAGLVEQKKESGEYYSIVERVEMLANLYRAAQHTAREDTVRPDVIVRHPSAGPELRTRAEWAFQLGYNLDGNVDTNGEKITIAEFNRSLSDAAHAPNRAEQWDGAKSKQLEHLTVQINRLERHLGLDHATTQHVIDVAIGQIREGAGIKPRTPDVAPVLQKRNKLPDTRHSITHKFDVGGQKGYITVGCYPQDEGDGYGQPGEVFIHIQRQGSTLQGFADAWARSLSMLLQYGVPVSEIARMFAWHKFEPRGHTPNPDIPYANSLVDYVARFLGYQSIPDYNPGGEPVAEVSEVAQ
jgi:hypothetical protein